MSVVGDMIPLYGPVPLLQAISTFQIEIARLYPTCLRALCSGHYEMCSRCPDLLPGF